MLEINCYDLQVRMQKKGFVVDSIMEFWTGPSSNRTHQNNQHTFSVPLPFDKIKTGLTVLMIIKLDYIESRVLQGWLLLVLKQSAERLTPWLGEKVLTSVWTSRRARCQ
jgi:hypothetical protein